MSSDMKIAAHLPYVEKPLAPDAIEKVRRMVARNAANAEDEQVILDALGIGGWLEKDDSKHVVSETFERGPNLTVPTVHTITLTLTPIGAL